MDNEIDITNGSVIKIIANWLCSFNKFFESRPSYKNCNLGNIHRQKTTDNSSNYKNKLKIILRFIAYVVSL